MQEGGGGHDNSSMQEFQKHKQALRVSNSFARGPAKEDCRGFDGDYTEVNIQKRTNSYDKLFDPEIISYHKSLWPYNITVHNHRAI